MKHAIPGFLIIFQFSFLLTHAQLTKSTAEIAYTITRMAEIYHVQPRTVDQSFSIDLYNQMIRALDQDKIYFSAQDIHQLEKWQYTLNDELLSKKADFLTLLISIYTRKINQTDSILELISKTKVDLNQTETYAVAEDSSFSPDDARRKTKIYKLIKRNIIETIVDTYNDDSTKKNIAAEVLKISAQKKINKDFKREIQRKRRYKDGIV